MSEPRELEGGFSRKAIGWITGVGVASFLLALVLTAFADDLFGRPTPAANSFSRSALGHRAVVELLQSLGVGAVSRRTPGTGDPGPLRPLIAAEPDPAVLASADGRLAELRREARSRGAVLVVVLPKWTGIPDPSNPSWIRSAVLMPESEAVGVLAALDEPGFQMARLSRERTQAPTPLPCSARWISSQGEDFRVELMAAQLLDPRPGLSPEVVCNGRLLVASHQSEGGPEIFVVSDPDLLNNHGLARGDNAGFVHALLTHRLGARGAVFDETIHGFRRTPGLLAEAFRFPLLTATLQAAVLVGILLWAGMGRFGKPRQPPGALGEGRQVLIDSTARLLTWGGHAGESLGQYFRQTVRALAAHFALPADLPEAETLDRLQRISRERRLGMDLDRLRRQADNPTSSALGSGQDADQALSLARDLHRWREEMMDGHRTHP